MAPVRDANGSASHYLAVKQDITERKRAEAEIHHLAYFDSLTHLPNRRLLMDRLGQALLSCRRSQNYGAVLILDLDNFKGLNDTRGHDVGDQLLVEMARRLSASVREEDTVARLGGDEYVVILENLDRDEAAAAHLAGMIAEKIRQALGQPFVILDSEAQHESTASMGITLFHAHSESEESLLKQADVALYQAKDAGRKQIRFFNLAMQTAIDTRIALENALRQALPRKELQLHYQPQVDAQGKLTGVEALLRWRRGDGTLVPPNQFIHLAEESGQIMAIGAWVIHTACSQLAAWSTDPATRDLDMAVNISSRQFHQPDFVDQVATCIRTHVIHPSRLKLELTESVVLDNVEEVIQRMQALKALGVRFSLDDFGTGYSSLSYLKRLPLEQVKIDQSFVRDNRHRPQRCRHRAGHPGHEPFPGSGGRGRGRGNP